jgi:ubiquinone/menaquinone biosynthesis C-methylase UbiE
MLPRILEQEVMDTEEDARDYDAMDHREVNARFAEDFCAAAANAGLRPDAHVLDVGTGTARIPIEIARRLPQVQITAIDLAAEMLALGQLNVERDGFGSRIRLALVDAKSLPVPDGGFTTVVSNSIVHHVPEPLTVIREMARAVSPGGVLFVRDLLRPQTMEELRSLVERHAAGANDHQRKLFADSLHAALTVEEVADLLEQVGVPREAVKQTSDRHWTVVWVRGWTHVGEGRE